MGRTYVLLGASGLVGGFLQKLLAADSRYERGTLLSRRVLGLAAPNVRDLAVDFDRPETYGELLAVDDVFCCLGTTIKKAGSQEAFAKVDRDIPLAVARQARERGARQYLIVTAVGVSPESRIFYNRVKGEVEAALAALHFPGGLQVFRPSLILGERNERRPTERLAQVVMGAARPLFAGGLTRYRPIDAAAVARAMLRVATTPPDTSGDAGAQNRVSIYEGDVLFAAAGAQ